MKLIASFKYALNGIWIGFSRERNMKIHLLALIVMSALGFGLQISKSEWIIQLMLFGLVICTELFNTAIELITDSIYKTRDVKAKAIKDVSAGAVLVMATSAAAVGLIIYLPKIYELI